MSEVSVIGLDLAKHVFQVHGADGSGQVVVRKQLRRHQVLEFFGRQPACLVAMEACSSAHYWGWEIGRLGHEVRLIPPAYVKPFVKRQKSDLVDAEAIAEAAQRPTMRFVAVKSEESQAAAVILRTRDLLVRQRTQLINAMRGHLAEFGAVVPQGAGHVVTCCPFPGPRRAGLFQFRLGPRRRRATMKRSKFSEAQIAFVLKQAEDGTAVGEVCRKVGISEATRLTPGAESTLG